MSKKPKTGTCATSHSPNKSMERKITDVVVHESDMAESDSAPYRNMAEYKMVPKDDDNGTFSSSRS